MNIELLKPDELDLILRYPLGRCVKLAKAGRIPHIVLPDGSIRFRERDVQNLLAAELPMVQEGQR